MSRVCNHGTDQSDRWTNVARFCDLTCTLDLWTGPCSASTELADSSHAILQISAQGLIQCIQNFFSQTLFDLKKSISGPMGPLSIRHGTARHVIARTQNETRWVARFGGNIFVAHGGKIFAISLTSSFPVRFFSEPWKIRRPLQR